MSLLQYTSGEMFSSTELIRKSKNIFDKLNKNEIQKAVILRDGKPSFMLMDFMKYEKLITQYLELQEKVAKLEAQQAQHKKELQTKKTEEEIETKVETKKETTEEKKEEKSEINSAEYEQALAKIDELNLELGDNKTLENESNDQQLKDFWE